VCFPQYRAFSTEGGFPSDDVSEAAGHTFFSISYGRIFLLGNQMSPGFSYLSPSSFFLFVRLMHLWLRTPSPPRISFLLDFLSFIFRLRRFCPLSFVSLNVLFLFLLGTATYRSPFRPGGSSTEPVFCLQSELLPASRRGVAFRLPAAVLRVREHLFFQVLFLPPLSMPTWHRLSSPTVFYEGERPLLRRAFTSDSMRLFRLPLFPTVISEWNGMPLPWNKLPFFLRNIVLLPLLFDYTRTLTDAFLLAVAFGASRGF